MNFGSLLDSLTEDEISELTELVEYRIKEEEEKLLPTDVSSTSQNSNDGPLGMLQIKCRQHNHVFIGYCERCKRCICKDCIVWCKNHSLVSISQFSSRAYTRKDTWDILINQSPGLYEAYTDKYIEAKNTLETHKARLVMVKEQRKNRDKYIENDISLLDEALELIGRNLEKTKLDNMKKKYEKIIENLSNKDLVRAETMKLDEEYMEVRKQVIFSRQELSSIEQTLCFLSVLINASENEDIIDTLGERELERVALAFCGPLMSYQDEVSYRGIPVIGEALASLDSNEMNDTCGIFYNLSKPLGWPSGPIMFGGPIACMSKDGWFAAYYGSKKEVEFRNLMNNDCFKITGCTNLTTPVVFCGKTFLFVDKNKSIPWMSIVGNNKDINFDALEKLDFVGCTGICDTTMVNTHGLVRFLSTTNKICIYDLNNDSYKELCKKTANSGSLVPGVCPEGVAGFCTVGWSKLSAIYQDGRSVDIGPIKGTALLFVPSATLPENLRSGLILGSLGSWLKSQSINPSFGGVKFAVRGSIIHIAENIYLVYDTGCKDWRLLKIFVP